MNEENNKMGFLSKLKTSIFKLEEYDKFLTHKMSQAFGYFVLVVLILTSIFSGFYTYEYSKQLNKAFSYIENEMPDFSYENNILKSENNVEAYDDEYDVRLFINTDEILSEENIKDYENKASKGSIGFVVLKDRISVIIRNSKTEYTYPELENLFGNPEISNKQSLIDIINSVGLSSIISIIFGEILIVYFIQNLIELFIYVLMIAMFGYIACGFAKVRIPLKNVIILAIYSVTLPNILYQTYIITNLLTGFYIKYFSLFYMLISCVYIFAAIFMIKSDIIKQGQEIQSITEVQKQVREEAEQNLEDTAKEKNKEDKKEENEKPETPEIGEDNEPDGSEI